MDFKQTKLTYLSQISDKRAALFAKLNINNLEDLLLFFPRAYEDWTKITPLHLVEDGTVVTVKASLVSPLKLQHKGKLSWVQSSLSDGATVISVIWFNQPWLMNKLVLSRDYYFMGKVQRKGRAFTLQSPKFFTEEEYEQQKLQAIYALTAGLNQTILRKAIKQVLELYDNYLIDPLAESIRQQFELCTLEFALHKIHQPGDAFEHQLARTRLAFEELFLVRAALYLLKQKRENEAQANALKTTPEIKEKMKILLANLPFKLTKAQAMAINDIIADLKCAKPMNRLLQGDVGSGKTLVAAFALAYVVFAGGQGAFMAPTSILAEQHYRTLSKLLEPLGLKIELLTGQTGAKKRREIIAGAAEQTIDIIIGTHALLEKDLVFKNPVLTITDEQHRFGVEQRSALSDFGQSKYSPHRLVMSATPIPRTLGLILYGDLDLSIMTELPAGRKPIKTYTAKSSDKPRIYQMMRNAIARNEQVYVVCPLIEDSELQVLESAEVTYEHFRKQVFPDLNVGLMHGALKAEQKNQVMTDFLAGKIDILISTTVIEVGVDNPNATMMLIQNAERFGLAQLHQLRGRIGRSDLDSICILLSDSEESIARERLVTLCKTQDGFELAEKDLKLRGPGDFFGTKQHGLPQFKLLNLYSDQAIINNVEQAFNNLIKKDPRLQENKMVIAAINQRYPLLLQGLTL